MRAALSNPLFQVERVRWWENGKVVVGLAMMSLAVLLAVVLASVTRFFRRLFFRRRRGFEAQPGTLRLTVGSQLAAWAWVVVAGVVVGVLSLFLSESTLPPTRAFDKYFVIENVLAGAALLLSLWSLASGVRIWFSDVRIITKIKFWLVALACLLLSLIAIHWNVIGSAHRY